MSAHRPPHDRRAPAPPAMAAFLRGVERRGAVLAQLQAGDADAGDVALLATMRQFRVEAPGVAMSDWSERFWASLLRQPSLRHRTPVALPLDATDNLAQIPGGPRAALLLRLAAGLSEADAARALGVAPASYRLALQRALPRHADGRADPQAWQRLRESIHRRIKTLPPERLRRLSDARQALLQTASPAARAQAPASATAAAWPRWLRPVLWILLGLCAVALAASFWSPWTQAYRGVDAGQVRVRPLATVAPPASRYDELAGWVSHRDFELLADPQGVARARDLALHSWLLARGKLPGPVEAGVGASSGSGAARVAGGGDDESR